MNDKTDRRNKILRLVIKEYVKHGKPVASKHLLSRFNLEVSSATIRNDFAYLEEKHFLRQPHTSAGRIPTEKAYRHHVDSLKNYPALSPGQEREVALFYGHIGKQAEDLIKETANLLSRLTNAFALVYAPCFDKSKFKHIDLVFLTPESLLFVLIANTGAIFKSTMKLGFKARPVEVDYVERKLNAYFSRLKLWEVKKIIAEGSFPSEAGGVQRELTEAVFKEMVKVIDREESRCFFIGKPFDNPDFEDTGELAALNPYLQSWLESEALQAILNRPIPDESVAIMIGNETPETGGRLSLVLANYFARKLLLGKIGVITPLRADYPRIIATVDYVAKRLSSEVSSYYE